MEVSIDFLDQRFKESVIVRILLLQHLFPLSRASATLNLLRILIVPQKSLPETHGFLYRVGLKGTCRLATRQTLLMIFLRSAS
jgi:hypothetical protein